VPTIGAVTADSARASGSSAARAGAAAGAGAVAADPYRFLAFLDLDLGDARFLEQLDQFLDLANVHRDSPSSVSLWCGRGQRGAARRASAASSANS
jgi:hypothetical protein